MRLVRTILPLLLLSFCSAVTAQEFKLDALLPTWPLSNVGDAIPQDLIETWRSKAHFCRSRHGAFPAFPSKGNTELKNNDGTPRAAKYEGEQCDDGDQTLFNGLLCASGVKEGCDGVSAAQGEVTAQ